MISLKNIFSIHCVSTLVVIGTLIEVIIFTYRSLHHQITVCTCAVLLWLQLISEFPAKMSCADLCRTTWNSITEKLEMWSRRR